VAATDRYMNKLMAAALALPGIASGADILDSGDVVVDYKHLYYDEQDDLMQVDADYLTVGFPVNDKSDLQLSLEYESMSGASPIFTAPGSGNKVIQVNSGASITDERYAGALRYRHDMGGGVLSVTPSISDENDYTSYAVTTEYQWSINDKNTTFALGAGYADDTVEPTDQDLEKDRDSASLFGGITQVLDSKSLIQTNVSFVHDSGYLTDPYKLALVEDAIIQESRPDDRNKGVLLVRYIRHIGDDAAAHLSYRFYGDDWSMSAHTVEGTWHQEFSNGWMVSPGIRYYTQHKADFYAPFFNHTPGNGNYSSDYRLASFGSVMAGVKVEKNFSKSTKVDLRAEYYTRRGDLKFSGDYSIEDDSLESYAITFGLHHTF
jgi:hypothetical protein